MLFCFLSDFHCPSFEGNLVFFTIHPYGVCCCFFWNPKLFNGLFLSITCHQLPIEHYCHFPLPFILIIAL